MRAVRLITGLLLGLLVVPLGTEGPQAARIYRIGFLALSACPAPPYADDRFRQVLRDVGYVEGRNIVIECRGAAGQTDRLLDLAAELARLKVDILVTQSTPAALAAQRATTTIPVVFSFVADAVASGLVTSLARPGGNLTGLSIFGPEKVPKQLELLKEVSPRISRVAILADLANPGQVAEIFTYHNAAAKALGLKLQVLDVRSPADLDAAFGAALRERAEALFLAPLRIGRADAERIMEFAVKNRLPTIGSVSGLYVPAGVLLFYTPSIAEQYQRLASYVDKILKGAQPGDLPVEQPTKFEVIFNAKTAKALGLTIPSSLLLRADQVIE